MDAFAYASQVAAITPVAESCRRCRPPVLCAAHVQALTAVRRERTATLLVRRDTDSPQAS